MPGAYTDLRAFLDRLAARGIKVEVEGGSLRVEPWPSVEAEERERLVAEKPAILALLAVSLPGGRVSESAAAVAAANPEPALKVSPSWGGKPRRYDPTKPFWRQGDPSKPRLAKTTSRGVRVYNDFSE
ncbi:MAG TPA: hypothetical protein VMR44_05825 [Thermoanaerobaculia bacterium]|nr:hypothetical protein [Thermoanaerobaculia bacterium]